MLFDCEFCGEQGMELKEGKMSTPWNQEFDFIDIIEMQCIHCGAHEPCENDDLAGFMMQILGEKNYGKAMVKALKILWEHEHLKELKE